MVMALATGLHLLLARGEGRAPEITVTKYARFDELENHHEQK